MWGVERSGVIWASVHCPRPFVCKIPFHLVVSLRLYWACVHFLPPAGAWADWRKWEDGVGQSKWCSLPILTPKRVILRVPDWEAGG